MLNVVVLTGRLTQDPELRYTPGEGIAVANFTLAVSRPFTNQQGEREADFIKVVAWRKQAENVSSYLKKGSLVALEGRLQVRSYDDKDGIKRKVAEVVARSIQFLDSRDGAKVSSQEGTEEEDEVPFWKNKFFTET
ncbi:MAG: single-stranded DNA-binding protein [Bacillota bacterium]